MKRVFIFFVSLLLGGCAWGGGGADYVYRCKHPDGSKMEIEVHSVRQVEEGVKVTISPDGTTSIETGGLTAGANNLGTALEALKNATEIATKAMP